MSNKEEIGFTLGFPDSKSNACFTMPSDKRWIIHFYDSAVLSTQKTSVTLLVTDINITMYAKYH